VKARGVETAGDFLGFVTDLGVIGALRSAWDRHSSDSIVDTLATALLRMLDLRFVFVRLHDTTRELSHDFLRLDRRYRIGNEDITVALQPWLSEGAMGQRLDYAPLGDRALSVTALELGSSGLGRLIVGAARDRFPSELEELLLRAAVNEACVALLEHSHQSTLRDITERKRTEQALARAQQELAHAARVLSIGELTASLAHEINQPLAAIVANAHAARRWLDRKVPNYKLAQSSLENIVRDGNRASAIIQRVRSFSAKALPSRDRLDVNDVIREVVAIASHEIAREQVGLRTHLAEHLAPVVADRIELQQVLLNLVINSIEALRPVVDRPKDLLITTTRRNKSTVEVSVTDNGSGIDTQHIERMFDAFFTTKSDGMGLGLAISRRIIEAHNGVLRVTPNSHWGLTLAFTLPISRRRRPESANGRWHPG
jgi:C4-dicarboxylate-specific signal transduction histidine kinase